MSASLATPARIVSIGGAAEADETVDAKGMALAPGFIDVHTHDDLAVIHAPDHACKTLQGVTTVVVGNCGSSVAPFLENDPGAPYQRMGEYFEAVESAGPAVNVAALIGHGTIRTAVMGRKTAREADEVEDGFGGGFL